MNLDNLTNEELKDQLLRCFALLEDRDRDLTVAAEVGQHLLEANNALLESRCSQCHLAYPVETIDIPLAAEPAVHLPGTPFTPALSSPQNPFLVSSKARNCRHARIPWSPIRKPSTLSSKSSMEALSPNPSPSTSPTRKTRVHRSPSAPSPGFDISDYISTIEKTNADLQSQVSTLQSQLKEETLLRAKESSFSNATITDLKDQIASLTTQLTDLQQEKRRVTVQLLETQKEKYSAEIEDADTVETLLTTIHQLESSLSKETTARQHSESRLSTALQELSTFQSRVSESEERARETPILHDICTRQDTLITELKDQLEDARLKYTNLIVELSEKPAQPISTDLLQFPLPQPANPLKELIRCPSPTAPQGLIYDRVVGTVTPATMPSPVIVPPSQIASLSVAGTSNLLPTHRYTQTSRPPSPSPDITSKKPTPPRLIITNVPPTHSPDSLSGDEEDNSDSDLFLTPIKSFSPLYSEDENDGETPADSSDSEHSYAQLTTRYKRDGYLTNIPTNLDIAPSNSGIILLNLWRYMKDWVIR